MSIFAVCSQYRLITFVRAANEIPKVSSNKQFFISKELSDSLLFPGLIFTEAVIGSSEENLYLRLRW